MSTTPTLWPEAGALRDGKTEADEGKEFELS